MGVDRFIEMVLLNLTEMGEVTYIGLPIIAIERKDIDNNGCIYEI